MKSVLITALVALATGTALPALAANDHMNHMDHGAMQGQGVANGQLVEGQIKKVDKAAGKVTLSHGPLPNGMPAMTMVFGVKDPAWIDQMKAGDKIRFKADQVNGTMTLVQFEPAK